MFFFFEHFRLSGGVAEVRADRVVVGRVVPVDHGVVQAYLQAALAAGFRIFPDDVPVDLAFGVIVRLCAVEEAETFMVLAGEHHVPAARIPGQLGPFFRDSFPRLEEGERFGGVRVRIHFHVFLNPFGTAGLALPFSGQSGVQAVVNEHAEFGVPPPLHAPVAFRRGFPDGGMVGVGGHG